MDTVMERAEMLLKPKDIETLERRAQNAVNGYAADVNINCYIYGKDVLLLLNERRQLLKECDLLRERVAQLEEGNQQQAEENSRATHSVASNRDGNRKLKGKA